MQKSRTTVINKILSIIVIVTLLMTLLTVVLVMSSKPSAIFPSTNSQSAQDNEASAFMSKVAGLDMAQYTMSTIYTYPGNATFDEMISYALTSSQNRVDALCIFHNGALISCKLNPISGSPIFVNDSSTDPVNAAKIILANYQKYSGATYLPTMREMLNFTIALNEGGDLSSVAGDVNLQVTINGNTDNFVWSYEPNGIGDIFKALDITVQNGYLQSFSDNWSLFKIGAQVNVTVAQAIKIATDSALKEYPQLSGSSILDNDAMATLNLENREAYTLYPEWEILLPLAQPAGATTCIQVFIWADTGQVNSVSSQD